MKNGLFTKNDSRKWPWSKHNKATQTTSKAEIHQKKIKLSVRKGGRVWYILSCFQGIKRLTRMSTVNNWTNWIQLSTRSDQNWSIVKVSYFIRTTLDRIHLWSFAKNWESLVANYWCIHHIALTLHRQTTICFCLCRTP